MMPWQASRKEKQIYAPSVLPPDVNVAATQRSLVQSWVEQERKGVDDGRGGLMSEKDPTRHQNSECSKNLGTDSKISTPISCNTETIFRSCKTFMLTVLTVRLLHFPKMRRRKKTPITSLDNNWPQEWFFVN